MTPPFPTNPAYGDLFTTGGRDWVCSRVVYGTAPAVWSLVDPNTYPPSTNPTPSTLTLRDSTGAAALTQLNLYFGTTLEGSAFALSDGTVGLARLDPTGTYNPLDGGISLLPGASQLHGSVTNIQSLASTSPKQVYSDSSGNLYGVEPPVPGWELTDTDSSQIVIGDFIGIANQPQILSNLFVPITALEETTNGRVTAAVSLTFESVGNKDSRLEIGFSDQLSAPTIWYGVDIAQGVTVTVPLNITNPSATLINGEQIHVWVRYALTGNSSGSEVLITGSPTSTLSLSGGGHTSSTTIRTIGWGSWADLDTDTGAAGSAISVDQDLYHQITINDTAALTTQLPPNQTPFFDLATDSMIFDQEEDVFTVRVGLKAEVAAIGTDMKFDLLWVVGGADPATTPAAILFRETHLLTKGAGTQTTHVFTVPFSITAPIVGPTNSVQLWLQNVSETADAILFSDFSLFIQKTYHAT